MNLVPDCVVKSLEGMDIGEIVRLTDGTLGIVVEVEAPSRAATKQIVSFPDEARGLKSYHVATPSDLDEFHALSMGTGFVIVFDPCGKGALSTEGAISVKPGNLVLGCGKLSMVVARPDIARNLTPIEGVIRRSAHYETNMFQERFVIAHWEVRHVPLHHHLPPLFSC